MGAVKTYSKRRNVHYLTDAEKAESLRLRALGITTSEIAVRLGIPNSMSMIAKHLARAAPATRRVTGQATAGELALEAARGLGDTFTLSRLAVAAFKLAPHRFALRGYPEYPDSKRVCAELTRLVRLRRVVRVCTGVYRVAAGGEAVPSSAPTAVERKRRERMRLVDLIWKRGPMTVKEAAKAMGIPVRRTYELMYRSPYFDRPQDSGCIWVLTEKGKRVARRVERDQAA